MGDFRCMACDGERRMDCEKLYERTSDRVYAVAMDCADELVPVSVADRLDIAQLTKAEQIHRLRFPLSQIGCTDWDNEEVLEQRLTDKLAWRA